MADQYPIQPFQVRDDKFDVEKVQGYPPSTENIGNTLVVRNASNEVNVSKLNIDTVAKGYLEGKFKGDASGEFEGTFTGDFETTDGNSFRGSLEGPKSEVVESTTEYLSVTKDAAISGDLTVNGIIRGDFEGTVDGDLSGTFNGEAKGTFEGSVKGDVDGNASTANKIKNAQNITFQGAVTGSTSFDGSKALIVNLSLAESVEIPAGAVFQHTEEGLDPTVFMKVQKIDDKYYLVLSENVVITNANNTINPEA